MKRDAGVASIGGRGTRGVGTDSRETPTRHRPPSLNQAFPGGRRNPPALVGLDCFYIGKLTGVGEVWQLTAVDTHSWTADVSIQEAGPPAGTRSASSTAQTPLAGTRMGPTSKQ